MKEKEAAAHLALVEQKAKRVDQLEGQLVILEMDKEKLKREINTLSDQVTSLMDVEAGHAAPKKASVPNFGNFQALGAGARHR